MSGAERCSVSSIASTVSSLSINCSLVALGFFDVFVGACSVSVISVRGPPGHGAPSAAVAGTITLFSGKRNPFQRISLDFSPLSYDSVMSMSNHMAECEG